MNKNIFYLNLIILLTKYSKEMNFKQNQNTEVKKQSDEEEEKIKKIQAKDHKNREHTTEVHNICESTTS